MFGIVSSLILILIGNQALIVSGRYGEIHWEAENWARSCDFNGNDLKNVRISSKNCGGECAKTDECTHFTWTQYEGGTCWMKKGQISKSNAFLTSDPSMVCGVMEHITKNDGSAGFTTRYWDCCKPSCGWSGKVSGSNSYVRSCQRDGYSAHGNPNVRSGCDGGEAFACNNQQPIVINDQLAYGFAAASIRGMSEQDRCCSCYELEFTSDPLRGKKMIVQITNSGSDVQNDQFDLQIPGGGVGIFNGCSSQWNTGTDGWGQRYGGVTSRDQCYALPDSIRGGCFFRFDWFQGASNPQITYKPVGCPSELVSITGCSR